MFETSREGDPHKLVFFEIFSSSAARKFHLEQDYIEVLFTAFEGKLPSRLRFPAGRGGDTDRNGPTLSILQQIPGDAAVACARSTFIVSFQRPNNESGAVQSE